MKLFKTVVDRGLQRLLKAYERKVTDEEASLAHDRLMEAVLHTRQDAAPSPAVRPFFRPMLNRPPFYPAAVLGLAMLVFGVYIGQSLEPVSGPQSLTPALSTTTKAAGTEQKVSVLAMASPWGEWIEEGE